MQSLRMGLGVTPQYIKGYDQSWVNVCTLSFLAIEPFHRSAVQLTIIISLSLVPGGIALLNAHRDPFGDVYPDGVWGNFDKSFSLLLSKSVVALASFNGEFIVVSKLVLLFILWPSVANNQNYCIQEEQSFFHAQDFSLTLMMNVRLFWLQQPWLGILMVQIRLLRAWRLVLLIHFDTCLSRILLKYHYIICRLRCCFQTIKIKKGNWNIVVYSTMLL